MPTNTLLDIGNIEQCEAAWGVPPRWFIDMAEAEFAFGDREEFEGVIDNIHHDDCIQFMSRMPDKCVDMVLTDIPYNEVNYQSGGLRVLDKGRADRLSFDLTVFVNALKRITKQSIYVFCGIQQISRIYTQLRTDMSVRLCHWQKSNPSPMNGNRLWLSATENCVFGKYSRGTFTQHCLPNVWRVPRGDSKLHPTQKPLELFKLLVEASTTPGDLVFDPCIGSGTTARACVTTGRRFIGVDNDRRSVDVARQLVRSERRYYGETQAQRR